MTEQASNEVSGALDCSLLLLGEDTYVDACEVYRSGLRMPVRQMTVAGHVIRHISHQDAMRTLNLRAMRLISDDMPLYLQVRVRRLEVARDRAADDGDFTAARKLHETALSAAAEWPKRGCW